MEPTKLIFDAAPIEDARLVFGETPDVPPHDSRTRLVFSQPPVIGLPVRLVFGDAGDDTPPPEPINVTLAGAGAITGLRLRIGSLAGVAKLSGTGRITGLRLRIAARYDINVSRPTVGGAIGRWQDAAPLPVAARSGWQQSAVLPAGTRTQWQDAERAAVALLARWSDTDKRNTAAAVRYEEARRVPAAPVRSRFQETERRRLDVASRFQEATRLPAPPVRVRFQEMLHDRQARVGSQFQVAITYSPAFASGMGIAVRVQRPIGGRFQEAWAPRPGQWMRPNPALPAPCYLPTLPARLVFQGAYDPALPARLTFICERAGPQPPDPTGETIVVPIRRVYVTVNTITLTRVSDGMPLAAESFGMQIDTDSWTWSWSASMQLHLRQFLAPVAGVPVQVEAIVNGVPYRLCVESISSDRSFGRSRLAVRGRGIAAILDSPYAPTQNFGNAGAARTAQQLMADVLTVNGVGIGWDVDFGLQDWLVPAGAWSHQGNYVSAINAIASAAGGYVQPHRTMQVLRVLPRYPVAPWHWGSVVPDFELPSAVVSVEGIEWTTKPAYDRVHVSGMAQGVLAEATRAGTAGGMVAPMVTDALITHADAARQRATAVLSDTGAQAHVTLKLPVLAETGIIAPGKFVRYTDGGRARVGLVRGTSLDFARPTLRQSIRVETHSVD